MERNTHNKGLYVEQFYHHVRVYVQKNNSFAGRPNLHTIWALYILWSNDLTNQKCEVCECTLSIFFCLKFNTLTQSVRSFLYEIFVNDDNERLVKLHH